MLPTSRLAIASFTLGLLTFPTLSILGRLGFLTALLAIIFGIQALLGIKKGLFKGKAFAIIGTSFGGLVYLLLLLAIVSMLTNTPWIFPLHFLISK